MAGAAEPGGAAVNALIPLTAADLLQTGFWFQQGERLFEITAWDKQQPLRLRSTRG